MMKIIDTVYEIDSPERLVIGSTISIQNRGYFRSNLDLWLWNNIGLKLL